jgi:hypothetical protein
MCFEGDVNSQESGLGIKDLLLSKREEILRTAARHGARNVRVFGSVAVEKRSRIAI